jgi:hypothetical protein
MAITAKLFCKAVLSMLNKEIDWAADTHKVALCTSTFTPNQDTMDYYNDLTNELTTTGGYTAGGATLGSPTITLDADTNIIKLDAADTTWSAATFTFRYAVIYDSTPGSDATNPIIGYVDFGADVGSTGADFTIQWNASGIFTFTVA